LLVEKEYHDWYLNLSRQGPKGRNLEGVKSPRPVSCQNISFTRGKIENSTSPKYRSKKLEQYDLKGYDVIIVDCSKLPSDIDEIHEYLKQFIVED
jgi:hypothetical protein